MLIDELLGRRFPRTLRMPITGTVGVLLLAKEAGLLSFVRPALDERVATGFSSDPELVADLVLQAGEAGSAG